MMNIHEELFAREFIIPEKRARYLSLLSSKQGRKKIIRGFHHIRDLDNRYAKLIAANRQSGESIFQMLKQKGAPETCFVISADAEIDLREMPLREALLKVEGSNFGTFVSCLAGRLGYFETEDVSRRYILEKN